MGEITLNFTNPLKDKPYRMWHRIAYYILCLGCALISVSCIVYYTSPESNLYSGFGTAAIICVVLFYIINMVKWRCPNCRRPLPLFGPILNCRYCKRSFMDSKGNQVW
jgi:membrane protein YdbS with pleckstrin-like domain